MKSVVGLLCSVIATINSYSQVLRKPLAASCTGMGAYSLKQVDVFSSSSNQASLSQLKNTEAGVYGERRFFLALNDYQAALAIATSAGNFGLEMSYYGLSAYRETQLGLAHARKLGNKLDVGLQFNYNTISLAGYGSASTITVECGTIFHITEQLHTGVHINNPVGGRFGKDQQEKLPAVVTAGIGYEASSLLLISGEIIKEEDQPVNINIGIHYQIISQLHLRAGMSTATSSVCFGAGFLWKALRLDIISSYHPQLGITPGLLIVFKAPSGFSKANDEAL